MAEPNYTMGTVNMQNTNPVPNNPPVQSTPATQADLNAFNQSLVVPKASNKADLSTITNSPQIKGDLTTPTAPVPSTAGVSSYAQLAQDALKNIQNQTNQQENAYTSIIDQYKTAQAATEGKNQYTQDLNNQYGVNTKAQAVQDIINQIQANEAALNQNKIGYGLNVGGVTASSQQAFNSEAERANTVKQLGLGASLAATQGNLALAQNFVNQAVAAKYDDAEARLKNLKDSYLMNKDELERVNKKAYDQQLMTLNAKQKDLEEKKKNFEAGQKMVIDASPFAPADITAKALKIVQDGGSQLQVAQALGKYGGDYLGNLVKQSQIAENYAQINKLRAEIKASQTTIPNNAPVGSTNYSLNNWTNSAIYKNSLTADERQGIAKSFSVVNQLGQLQQNLSKDQTSFFGGNVKKIMADIGQNVDAGTINAQITALVPQVAKGVYGEVGVLTDQDTARYTKVLPNLTSPEKQNAAVTALTLTALRNGVKSKLDVAAASKLDVSGFVPLYNDLNNKINKINDDTGVNDIRVQEIVSQNPNIAPMVADLVKKNKSGSEILTILGVEN